MQVARRFDRHAQRGQALTETAVILPLFLLVLFGMIWVTQTSVIGERSQIAVRFSGLVSNEAQPWAQYSLYALYNGLPGSSTYPAVSTCSTPAPDALLTNGQFSGISGANPALPFFTPTGIIGGSCTRGVAILQGGSLASPMVLIQTQSSIQSSTNVPSPLLGLGANSNITAQQNFIVSPDVPRLMSCYPELGTAVTNSITNVPQNAGATAPLSASPPTNALTVNTSCN